jgi:hypothetical protein
MESSSQHLIAEVQRRRSRVEMTIGVDLGDVWSHYCTLNEDGEVVDRSRFRTSPKAVQLESPWKRGLTLFGSVSSFRNWGTRSSWPTSASFGLPLFQQIHLLLHGPCFGGDHAAMHCGKDSPFHPQTHSCSWPVAHPGLRQTKPCHPDMHARDRRSQEQTGNRMGM